MGDDILHEELLESVLINLMVEEHDLQREEQGMPVLDEDGLERLHKWVSRLVSLLHEELISGGVTKENSK